MNPRQTDLPPLDLLLSFEVAARTLSFTQAASELHLTQSAISRQIKALEQAVGRPLFERQHRALVLTEAGEALQRSVSTALAQLRETMRTLGASPTTPRLTVTTTVTFASLWLIPRLPSFRAVHPEIDVRISANNATVDLAREGFDVAIRYCSPRAAPAAAQKLFGEAVVPVCHPDLLSRPLAPLRTPADLARHVLLTVEGAAIHFPWLDWTAWLAAMSLPDLKPAGEVLFSHYDQMIQAAIEGQGVALGRMPLLAEQIRRGRLVSPFDQPRRPRDWKTPTRAFYAIVEDRAAQRPEVSAFVDWLLGEAGRDRA